MLYKDGLVMYDRQTETLWTQVDGHAIRGALNGRHLEIVPAVHATWREWRALYPNTKILRKQGEFRSAYDEYNRNPVRLGIMGRRNVDNRLPGKERVLGVHVGDVAMAFPIRRVREARLVQTAVGEMPLLLIAATPDVPVLAYERRAGSGVLTFRLDSAGGMPVLRDAETSSTWDIATGKATAGSMAGAQMNRATAYPAFWFGWRGYFPATAVWDGADAFRH
jgi:hypothetical protein